MIRHILLIKFKPESTQEQIEELMAMFVSMTDKVDGVTDVEWEKTTAQKERTRVTHTLFL